MTVWHEPPVGALRLWRELAGDPTALAPGTRTLVWGSRGISPPGWVGAVRLGDAFALEVGAASDEVLDRLLGLDDPTSPELVTAALDPAETLGPGVLAYLPDGVAPGRPTGGTRQVTHDVTVALEPTDAVRAWLADLPADDVGESGLGGTEEVVVGRVDGEPVAAAGWSLWPTDVAHLGVLTDPDHRGRGHGTQVAEVAVARALDAGLVPQWRARHDNAASRAIAARLGFVEVGRQFSVRLP